MQENNYSGVYGILFIIISIILFTSFIIFDWVETQNKNNIPDEIIEYECDNYIKAFAGGDYSGMQRINITHFGTNCERVKSNNINET